ncbi:hypothetical protein GF367_02990 [Candidatus Woesearchaeota archaeon]|nr:hypothetical protein [Candidatus Woesearchaeota archaeon]
MAFHPDKQTVILTAASQLPIALLLLIFFRIPNLPALYRVMAVATVILEATLMSELIGNIVQKVRATGKGVVVRGVLERQRIPWERVKDVCQAVLSPMKKGGATRQQPTKLFLIKTEGDEPLGLASAWWAKQGPVAHRQTAMSGLVRKYDSWVRSRLKGWRVLWRIEYRSPQPVGKDVRMQYVTWDGRERKALDDIQRRYGKEVRFLDLTYPSFVRRHGGKYAGDVKHVWETLRA